MGWMVTLAVIGGYAWMVGRTAKRYAIEETENSIANWKRSGLDPTAHVAEWRRGNLGFGMFIGLFWPVYLLGRMIGRRMLEALPPSSVELEARERKIAQLERDLGIDVSANSKERYR